MPRNYMHPDQRGHGFKGRQGGDVQRHLPAVLYTPAGRALRAHARRHAKVDAERIVAKMKDRKEIEFADYRGEMAFQTAVEIMTTAMPVKGKDGEPIYEFRAKDRLAAANLLLNFSQTKPVTRVENTIKTAEDWLASVDDDSAE